MPPSDEIVARVTKLTGSRPVSWTKTKGGYSMAGRYIAELENGTSVFVKYATDELTALWLRDEYKAYKMVQGDFMPVCIGWEDGPAPILILESLAHGHWPPPWNAEQIERVFTMLKKLQSTEMPEEFPEMSRLGDTFNGWETVQADTSDFLRLGLVSEAWLTAALPVLVEAEQTVEYGGTSLVHADVRSDNLCLLEDRVVLVDWNWARRGNGMIDVVGWLPTLCVEGGPAPWTFDIHEPKIVAAFAGFYAAHAGKPADFEGADAIRELQLRLLKPLLVWVSKELNLPPPDMLDIHLYP